MQPDTPRSHFKLGLRTAEVAASLFRQAYFKQELQVSSDFSAASSATPISSAPRCSPAGDASAGFYRKQGDYQHILRAGAVRGRSLSASCALRRGHERRRLRVGCDALQKLAANNLTEGVKRRGCLVPERQEQGGN